MNKFNVSYYEVSKPKGKRSFFANAQNYDTVLIKMVMDKIHLQATKGYNFDLISLNHSVFVQRVAMNGMISEYNVQIHNSIKRDEVLGNYKVEIECDSPPKNNEELENLCEPYCYEFEGEYLPLIPKKTKGLTTWLENESNALRRFIIGLDMAGSLKEYKKQISKATYYRHLKVCKEKGYIKNGKLVKRVWIAKLEKV